MYSSCSVLEVKDAILQVFTHSLQLSWQGQVGFARTGGSDVGAVWKCIVFVQVGSLAKLVCTL